jgi:hypothetical protein
MPTNQELFRIAVLDDYQNVALSMANWSVLDGGPLSIRSVPGLDRDSQSSQHLGTAGAQRELERVITGVGR